MMPTRLSVCVIAWNEEKNIGRCLESVRWADEIVIVDNHSTDRTAAICGNYTDKITARRFENYADQKNHALSRATGEWVLSLDADEEVTARLRAEILEIMESDRAFAAYAVPRRSLIFGRWFRFSGTQQDRPVRFFKREGARFEQPVHETVRVPGAVGKLKNPLNHYTYPTISGYLGRLNRYTSMEAAFFEARGRRSGGFDLTARPFLMFIRLFVWKQGFRDGFEGFLFCWFSAFYVFLKYAKHAETARPA